MLSKLGALHIHTPLIVKKFFLTGAKNSTRPVISKTCPPRNPRTIPPGRLPITHLLPQSSSQYPANYSAIPLISSTRIARHSHLPPIWSQAGSTQGLKPSPSAASWNELMRYPEVRSADWSSVSPNEELWTLCYKPHVPWVNSAAAGNI